MTVAVFLLTLGATARLTRLVTDDYITRHLRAYLIRKRGPDSDIAYLATCPWCLSMWIAGILATLAWWYGNHPGYLLPAAALTISWLVGTAASLFDGEDN